MKEPHHQINRSGGSRCGNSEGNKAVKAHKELIGKLQQLSLVTHIIAVRLSDMRKPATPLEETEISTRRAIRGRMMLRVSQRLRMNVGYPNSPDDHRGLMESDMPIVVKIPEKVKAGGAKG